MVFASHPIDGSLASWQEVTTEYDDWAGLLLGNGLSRNVCRDFGYPSLFEKARRDGTPGSLSSATRAFSRRWGAPYSRSTSATTARRPP